MKEKESARVLFVTIAIIVAIGATIAVQAQPTPSPGKRAGQNLAGQSIGIRQTVSEIMDRSRAYDQAMARIGPRKLRVRREPRVEREHIRRNPLAPAVSQWPALQGLLKSSPFLPQSVGINFLGIQISESPYVPPDSMGAVGPTQLLVVANGRIKVFDKTGVLGGLNADTDVFFASVLNGSSLTDPQARFDRLTSRWFVTGISVDTPDRVMIAVSSGATITSSASFTFFQFQHDLIGSTPNPDTGGFLDYDSLGIDANALYIGGNVFNADGTEYLGSTGFVVRKSSVLGAGPMFVTAFRQLAGSSGPGLYSPRGVDNDDPAATEGYFIAVDNAEFSLLQIRRISNPGGTPTISGDISLTVPTTTYPRVVGALGSIRNLDSLDDRIFAAQLKNGSLWTAHNINVDSTGVATETLGNTGRNGSRFYEITNLTGTPTLRQSGTLFDNTVVVTGTARHIWIPTIAASGQGHMAMGATIAAPVNSAGTQLQPSVAVAGRLAGDALGTIQALTIASAGAGTYNAESTGPQRWGDYSAMNVDPKDDMTMWTFQEYCNATDSWGVRVLQLRAPLPAMPSSVSPANIGLGSTSVNVVVTGASSAGSGFFDPGADPPPPGTPLNHISASVTGGVIVNSAIYTDPTHVTLNLNTTGAALGSQNVTITNPDGQSSTGIGIVTVRNALAVSSAVSRKTHSTAGMFDINLPLSGQPGVECRSGGAGGNYTLVITFSNNVVNGNAAVTSGTGNVSGAPAFSANTMTVNLAGVTNAQTLAVSLTNVTDEFAQTLPNSVVNAGFLIGDTGGNRAVNATDVAQTKSRIGQVVNSTTFRSDVNNSGTISSSDISLVKANIGSALP